MREKRGQRGTANGAECQPLRRVSEPRSSLEGGTKTGLEIESTWSAVD